MSQNYLIEQTIPAAKEAGMSEADFSKKMQAV